MCICKVLRTKCLHWRNEYRVKALNLCHDIHIKFVTDTFTVDCCTPLDEESEQKKNGF